jgi:hypothetical protein
MSLFLYDLIEDPALIGTSGGFNPPFGSAVVKAYSPGGAFSPHNWLEWVGQYLQISLITGIPLLQATFWFAWKFEGPFCSGPIFQTMGTEAPHGNLVSTTSLKIEGDNTLSCYVSGSPDLLVFNSGAGSNPFYVQSNVWYYFQVGVTLSFSNVAPYPMQAIFNVFIDGETICTNTTGTSNFYIGPTPPNAPSGGSFTNANPGFTAIQWLPPNGGGANGLAEFYAGALQTSVAFPGNLWTLVVTNPGSGYSIGDTVNSSGSADIGIIFNGTGGVASLVPIAPNFLGDSYPNSPPIINLTINTSTGSGFTGYATIAPMANKRISQMATEVAELGNPNLRINQMGIEIAGRPSPNLRISQMVIELPYLNIPGGWIIKEC